MSIINPFTPFINRQFKKNRRPSTLRNKRFLSQSSNLYCIYGFLTLFFLFSLTSCACGGGGDPTSPNNSIPATNIITLNIITSKVTNFYALSNFIFSNRFESVLHYTTNAANFTNFFLSNSYSTNVTTNYVSNLVISVMTNTEMITNVIISTSNTYLNAIDISDYITILNGTLTNHYTNFSSPTNVGTNTDWNGLNFSTHILSDLNFSNYNFSNANFSNANFSNANLIGVNFSNANFTNANFTNAMVNFEGYNYLAKKGYTGYRSRDFQKILPSDGAELDQFGASVSISGDTAIVGAKHNDSRRGGAYIFSRTNGTWAQITKLTAHDKGTSDFFGVSVSISRDTAIVGADFDEGGRGAAYIFSRTNGTWAQITKLTASDGTAGDQFGISVSISGDTTIVGARGNDSRRGAAYIFSRTNGTWTQITKLTANDKMPLDKFGASVSISEDTAIVGATQEDDNTKGGVAYIFSRTNGTWAQITKLTATDEAANDQFAWSVSILGDTAIVGAWGDDEKGTDSGSAYLFQRQTNGNWTQVNKLLAIDGAANDRFGYSVSISVDTAIVTASQDDNYRGSAYIFSRQTDGNWLQSKMIAYDRTANDQFAWSVSISEDRAIVGAHLAGSANVIKFK